MSLSGSEGAPSNRVVWFLQGIGLLGGSGMSGVAFWAVVGVIVFACGVALLRSAGRFRRTGNTPREANQLFEP